MSGGHGGGRGGRRRGGHEEEHENSERWMVTYADMLTLLLVLFIVLYAISAVNVSKFNQLKSSLSSAFNGGSAPSVLPGGQGIVSGQPQKAADVQVGPKGPGKNNPTSGLPTAAAKAEADKFAKIEAAIKKSLKAQGLDGNASFAVNQRGLDVTVLSNEIVFLADSPVLQSGGQRILNVIIPTLKSVDNTIEVDGNTNQLQSATNGWLLSSQRAAAVINYIEASNAVADSRLAGAFNGPNNPAVNPSDPRAANLNRRVDIVLLTKYSAADRAGLFTPTGSQTPSATGAP